MGDRIPPDRDDEVGETNVTLHQQLENQHVGSVNAHVLCRFDQRCPYEQTYKTPNAFKTRIEESINGQKNRHYKRLWNLIFNWLHNEDTPQDHDCCFKDFEEYNNLELLKGMLLNHVDSPCLQICVDKKHVNLVYIFQSDFYIGHPDEVIVKWHDWQLVYMVFLLRHFPTKYLELAEKLHNIALGNRKKLSFNWVAPEISALISSMLCLPIDVRLSTSNENQPADVTDFSQDEIAGSSPKNSPPKQSEQLDNGTSPGTIDQDATKTTQSGNCTTANLLVGENADSSLRSSSMPSTSSGRLDNDQRVKANVATRLDQAVSYDSTSTGQLMHNAIADGGEANDEDLPLPNGSSFPMNDDQHKEEPEDTTTVPSKDSDLDQLTEHELESDAESSTSLFSQSPTPLENSEALCNSNNSLKEHMLASPVSLQLPISVPLKNLMIETTVQVRDESSSPVAFKGGSVSPPELSSCDEPLARTNLNAAVFQGSIFVPAPNTSAKVAYHDLLNDNNDQTLENGTQSSMEEAPSERVKVQNPAGDITIKMANQHSSYDVDQQSQKVDNAEKLNTNIFPSSGAPSQKLSKQESQAIRFSDLLVGADSAAAVSENPKSPSPDVSPQDGSGVSLKHQSSPCINRKASSIQTSEDLGPLSVVNSSLENLHKTSVSTFEKKDSLQTQSLLENDQSSARAPTKITNTLQSDNIQNFNIDESESAFIAPIPNTSANVSNHDLPSNNSVLTPADSTHSSMEKPPDETVDVEAPASISTPERKKPHWSDCMEQVSPVVNHTGTLKSTRTLFSGIPLNASEKTSSASNNGSQKFASLEGEDILKPDDEKRIPASIPTRSGILYDCYFKPKMKTPPHAAEPQVFNEAPEQQEGNDQHGDAPAASDNGPSMGVKRKNDSSIDASEAKQARRSGKRLDYLKIEKLYKESIHKNVRYTLVHPYDGLSAVRPRPSLDGGNYMELKVSDEFFMEIYH